MYAESSKSHHQNVVETIYQYPETQFLHSFDWEYAKKLKVRDKTFPIFNTQLDGVRREQQRPCAKNRQE
jgi:hypothetical protein